MEQIKAITINLLVIAFLAIILIWGNTFYRQMTQYDRGERALAKGDYMAAIAGYEAAIHMYTPASGRIEKSAARLWDIGERLEQNNDNERSIIAYRALRSSFYAVRWLYKPGKEWIRRCDDKIAQLLNNSSKIGGKVEGPRLKN